jgi:hypothetical protein
MVRVRTGPEHRREPAARGDAQRRECLVARRGAGGRRGRGLPARLDREHPFIGELERLDVDRNSGPVRAGFSTRHPVAGSAFEAWSCPDRGKRRAQPAHKERCDKVADPAPERFGEAAGDDRLLGKPDRPSWRARSRDPDEAHRLHNKARALSRGRRGRSRLDDDSSTGEPGSALGRRPVRGGTGWDGRGRRRSHRRGDRGCRHYDDRLGSAELGRARRRLRRAGSGGSVCASEKSKAGETGQCRAEPPRRGASDVYARGASRRPYTSQWPCSYAVACTARRWRDGSHSSSVTPFAGPRAP